MSSRPPGRASVQVPKQSGVAGLPRGVRVNDEEPRVTSQAAGEAGERGGGDRQVQLDGKRDRGCRRAGLV